MSLNQHQKLQGLVCTSKSIHFMYVNRDEELECLPCGKHCSICLQVLTHLIRIAPSGKQFLPLFEDEK